MNLKVQIKIDCNKTVTMNYSTVLSIKLYFIERVVESELMMILYFMKIFLFHELFSYSDRKRSIAGVNSSELV